jgi:hypothetical protein
VKTDQEQDEAFCKETGADIDITLPEAGFIYLYHGYASPITEAPEIYHLFVGMSLIAAACGRNIYLPFGSQRIYPNVWVILVGTSSNLKKSTAINIGKTILTNVDPTVILPTEFSREALLELLQNKPRGLFCWNEFGGVLAQFELNYMAGTKEMMTDLFDCPMEHRRILKKQEIIITEPCISIVSASTLEWLTSKVKEQDVRSGFLARFIYVPGRSRSKLLPFPPRPNLEDRTELIHQLKQIATVKGEVSLTSDARKHYEVWYADSDRVLSQETDTERLSPFFSRLQTYAFKFAMIYQISENRSLQIEEENMMRACQLVQLLRRNVKELLEDGLVFGKEGQDQQKVKKLIVQAGALGRSNLLRQTHFDAAYLDRLVGTLIQQEAIRVVKEGKKVTYFRESSQR